MVCPLDAVSDRKPPLYDTAEPSDQAENQATPHPYPSDFGTMPSEAMMMSSEL